jgi:hypothetical protein
MALVSRIRWCVAGRALKPGVWLPLRTCGTTQYLQKRTPSPAESLACRASFVRTTSRDASKARKGSHPSLPAGESEMRGVLRIDLVRRDGTHKDRRPDPA